MDAKITQSFNEWEMVLVRHHHNNKHAQDDDLSVLPPSNHEGLQPLPPPPPLASEAELQAPSEPSSDVVIHVEGEERALQTGKRPKVARNEIRKLSRSGIGWMASRVCYYVVSVGGFYSVASITAVVAVVLLFSRVKRWRQWVREERKNHLFLLVKQRDQKISQLLVQIAQLNEMLSARRKVPVIRIG